MPHRAPCFTIMFLSLLFPGARDSPGGHHPVGFHDHDPDHVHTPGEAPLVSPVERLPSHVRLGTGQATFQPVPGWCQLPDETPLGSTHGGIVVDDQGLVYYTTESERSVMVHRPDGVFVRAIGSRHVGLHDVKLKVEGDDSFLYAAHLWAKQAVKLRMDGSLVWALGVPMESGKYEDPEQFNPTAIEIAPDGRIFVADGYGRNWIHVFTSELRYEKSVGGPGSEPGQFQTCHGLLIDDRGESPVLLVCDRENRRLQSFDVDGNFLKVVATDLRRPCALAIHGDWLAIAELEGRVTILDRDFEVIARLGDNPDQGHWANHGVPPEQWTEGIFTAPHAVQFDGDGNLYIMDWNASGRISKLKWVRE